MTMHMRKSDIYDAINLFKYSPTGQGTHVVFSQTPEFQAKYKKWAHDAVKMLWWKLSEDEIGFADLPYPQRANVPRDGWRIGYDIRLTSRFQKNLDLVGMSFALAHEGVHLAVDNNIERIQEEMICHTIECMYYENMMLGVRIKRKHTGVVRTFSLNDIIDPNHKEDLRKLYEAFRRQRVLDHVLLSSSYRDIEISSRWAIQALNRWGGLKNREGHTKGFLARAIVRDKSIGTQRLQPLVNILASLQGPPEIDFLLKKANVKDALVTLFEENKTHPTYTDWSRMQPWIQAALKRTSGAH